MTAGIVVLFLVGPIILVPIWCHLLPTPTGSGAAVLVRVARRLALPSGIALAAAFAFPTGLLAAILALPWFGLGLIVAFAAAIDATAALRERRRTMGGPTVARWAAMAFLAVAAGNAIADRAGIQPFGFAPTIILLTAVHFTFAGFVLVLVGASALERHHARWIVAALLLVIAGIPITAMGFFGVPLAAWVGAVTVAIGGMGVGLAMLVPHGQVLSPWSRRFGIVAGLSLLVSMPLAIGYASGVWFGIAALDIPAMVRTHGAINVLGFAVPATVAAAFAARSDRRTPGGPADALDVLGFNIAPFVLAPSAGLIVVVLSLSWALPAPFPIRLLLLTLGLGGIAWTVLAVLVVWKTFGADGQTRWRWIGEAAGRPGRWLNVTTGFDDSTAPLRAMLDGEGRSVDLFDADARHEAALRRARLSFRPAVASTSLDGLADVLPDGEADAVLLLMSGHEARGADRAALFGSLAAALSPAGRIVVVEHLRDAATVLAFGPGAWHFARRRDWLDVGGAAGLRLVEERRLSPWVRGFVFERKRSAVGTTT